MSINTQSNTTGNISVSGHSSLTLNQNNNYHDGNAGGNSSSPFFGFYFSMSIALVVFFFGAVLPVESIPYYAYLNEILPLATFAVVAFMIGLLMMLGKLTLDWQSVGSFLISILAGLFVYFVTSYSKNDLLTSELMTFVMSTTNGTGFGSKVLVTDFGDYQKDIWEVLIVLSVCLGVLSSTFLNIASLFFPREKALHSFWSHLATIIVIFVAGFALWFLVLNGLVRTLETLLNQNFLN